MSLLISGDLRLRNQLPADAEADAYIAAVEAADGQALEPGVKFAIKNFVLCCKQDGIWPAIKASCILAGARTLAGALVPLVGTAPTNVGLFVAGDYNRETGLVGDGSTKYLDTNRANNADPQNNAHHAIWISNSATGRILNSGTDNSSTGVVTINVPSTGSGYSLRNRNNNALLNRGTRIISNLVGMSRNSSTEFSFRAAGFSVTETQASQNPTSSNISIFQGASSYSASRLAFYSIGESLDLALLDARVTDLINAFAAAIP